MTTDSSVLRLAFGTSRNTTRTITIPNPRLPIHPDMVDDIAAHMLGSNIFDPANGSLVALRHATVVVSTPLR